MVRVTVEDVSRRKSSKRYKFPKANVISNNFPRLYTENGIFCHNNTIDTIQNWERLSEDTNTAFDKALDAFSELCLNANESVISTQCSFLLENVDKVRDANALMNSIKYKNSRLKSKISTKINNKLSSVNDAIRGSISNLNQTLHKAGVGSPGVAKSTQVSESFINECFDKLYNKANEAKECDRILNNYSKISKVFDLKEAVSYIYSENDIYQAVIDITECINNYNASFRARYNCALETSLYVLNNSHIEYPKNKIIEAATDYFILATGLSESDIEDIKKISRSSVLFTEEDFEDSEYLWQMPVSDDISSMDYIDPESYSDGVAIVSESLKKALNAKKNEIKHGIKDIKKDARAVNKMVKTNARKGNPEEARDEEVKAMVDDFRKECAKDKDNKTFPMKLKALVNKIFTRTPAQIVYELPSIFSIIRATLVVTTFAMNPIIGIISLITDQCIKLTLERKQMEKIINAYKNEISSLNSRIEKVKDNDEKDRLTKYRDKLKDDLEKLREYDRSNFTEEENDERNAYSYDDDFDDDNSGDDFDFGDDEWGDLDFDEAALPTAAGIIISEQLMESIFNGFSIKEDCVDANLDGEICSNIFKLKDDKDLDAAIDFVITVPVLHEREVFHDEIIKARKALRLSEATVDNLKRIDCLNDNLRKLSNLESTLYPDTFKGSICYLAALNEIANINGNEEYVTEMNFTNTLKLAMNNLKRGVRKLSDKEKKISNDLDVSVSQVSKSMETAMMNGNREAVIKGRVLPSASKCIKMALAVGVAWAVNPAIAVIGALGTFACMKKMQNKERQLVIDDIEIELKMCERYIRQAEDKNDLKKVREYEKIQRNLERQLQRIKYKMQIEYKMDTPDSTATPKGMGD